MNEWQSLGGGQGALNVWAWVLPPVVERCEGEVLAVSGGLAAVPCLVERRPIALNFRNVRAGPGSKFADRIG